MIFERKFSLMQFKVLGKKKNFDKILLWWLKSFDQWFNLRFSVSPFLGLIFLPPPFVYLLKKKRNKRENTRTSVRNFSLFRSRTLQFSVKFKIQLTFLEFQFSLESAYHITNSNHDTFRKCTTVPPILSFLTGEIQFTGAVLLKFFFAALFFRVDGLLDH